MSKFTCSMCNKEFSFKGTLPEASESEMIICTSCNAKVQAALSMLSPSQTSLQ